MANNNSAPPMSLDELEQRATRLYGGYGWQSALARELDVADRTVRRWVAGKTAVPGSAALALRLMTFLEELSWLGEWRKLLAEELDQDAGSKPEDAG